MGLRIIHDRAHWQLVLDQEEYISHVLSQFGYHNVILVSIDADFNIVLSIGTTQNDVVDDKFPYRDIVGELQFASIGTHLDITYVVSMATKFSFAPKTIHFNVIHKIWNTWKPLQALVVSLEMQLLTFWQHIMMLIM